MSMQLSLHLLLAAVLCLGSIPNYAATQAKPSKLAPHVLLLDAAKTEQSIIAVGERGHIIFSDLQGEHWQQAHVNSNVLLTSIFMLNSKLGWATGHDATILSTQDGGKNWQQLYSDPEFDAPLLDIWFSDAQHGLAIGAYGLLLASNDGGKSWQRRYVSEEDDWHLNNLQALDQNTLLIIAESGVIYRSDNAGLDWQKIQTPYQGSLFGALHPQPKLTLVYGLRGHILRSEDQGLTWQIVQQQTTALLSTALKTRAGDCLIAGQNGILFALKHCQAESSIEHQLPSRNTINAIIELSGQKFLLFTTQGVQKWQP